jgi:DNA-binding transcriptional ArsR family regulator
LSSILEEASSNTRFIYHMLFPSCMNHHIETYKFFFGALANPNRLQIINVLREGTKNVGQICKATGFEQTMVSHNLKLLELHGMVFMKKDGKFRNYSVNRKTIKPLLEFIDAHMKEYCCKILGKGNA